MPDRRASAVCLPARRRDVFQTKLPAAVPETAWWGPGDGRPRLRSRSSARTWLRKCHWPGSPSRTLSSPLRGTRILLQDLAQDLGRRSGTIASDALSYSACLTRVVHRRIFDADGTPFCLEALMASVSLHDLGIDRLSIEERLQVAEAIWDSVVHDVETTPLPDWQKAELERRLADSVANPDAVRPWADVEAEALARAK